MGFLAQVLGIEYCTGYLSATGNWTTGFYCPQETDEEAIFCCGSTSYKFCCSNNESLRPHSKFAVR